MAVWGTRIPLASRIGGAVSRYAQAWSQRLHEIAQVKPGDGVILVGDGSGWVGESGTSARSSLGLGTANNVQHAKIGAGVAPSFVLHAQGSPGTGSPVVKVKVATAYAAARGIGVELTDNPSSTGDYFLYFEDAGGLRGSISGDGGTGIDVNLTSDAGAKAMIRDADIGDARSIVRQIREADWDPLEADSPKARRGRGFIAQELAEVYPDAVRPAHEVTLPDGTVRQVPWQIAPMRLIPVLTRALREQDAEIESLKARLTALESR